MDVLIKLGQFLLAISLLVGIHELGHLLAAKWFGMRVEKYFIGFPPKLVGIMYKGTEYAIGLIPLGGFVKITGMVDESLDTAKLSKEPEPYEFRAKPAWQRLIVMLGGIIFNVILGIVVFAGLLSYYGESYLPASEAKYGIVPSETAEKIGLKEGDKILAVNGKALTKFYEVMGKEALLGENAYYSVERGGETLNVAIPKDLLNQLSSERFQKGFIAPAFPFKVGQLVGGMPAEKAGLMTGDVIDSVNGKPANLFHLLQRELKENKGKTASFRVSRNGLPMEIRIPITEDGLIGFRPVSTLKEDTLHYGFFEALPRGASDAIDVVVTNVAGLYKVIRGEVSAGNALQGPLGIMDNFAPSWDWRSFWALTGLLSMALAFMNLLPIPALDGGHALFLMYEIFTRRKPTEKFLEIAQRVGMVLLLSLMAFVILNDIVRKFF